LITIKIVRLRGGIKEKWRKKKEGKGRKEKAGRTFGSRSKFEKALPAGVLSF